MIFQILIPQYQETDEVVKPLLDSIALQQQVDFSENVWAPNVYGWSLEE